MVGFRDVVENAASLDFSITFHGGATDRVAFSALVREAEDLVAPLEHRQAGREQLEPLFRVALDSSKESVLLILASILAGHPLTSIPVSNQELTAESQLQSLRAEGQQQPIVASRPVNAAQEAKAWVLSQRSSGTTGAPKVCEAHEQFLLRNLRLVLEQVEPDHNWTVASWLPLSHDMGMVGVFLGSILAASDLGLRGGNLHLLAPERFAQNPAEWMGLCSEVRANLTACPGFALQLAARTAGPGGLDLSDLACVIVGAEPLHAADFLAFEQAFEGHRLRSSALTPAYGMAEVGIAVSMDHMQSSWIQDEETKMVLSGAPLVRNSVALEEHGEGSRIALSPAIVCDVDPPSTLRGPGNFYLTGDYGRFVGDKLLVLGRDDSRVNLRGKLVSVVAAEHRIADYVGRPVALLYDRREGLVVAIEGEKSDELSLLRAVNSLCLEELDTRSSRIEHLGRGSFPRTSSGKLRRFVLQERVFSNVK